jgi:glycosyltransferase involved in cell wall biosynthesis
MGKWSLIEENMNQDFTVITPTGDRPEAFSLCIKYLLRQTCQPKEWIIVDDGKSPMLPPLDIPYVHYIRRERQAGEPAHTLRPQMVEALKYVSTDKVIIMEDDDWYDPEYCETLVAVLDKAVLAGQGEGVYYHIPNRSYFLCKNKDRASRCQTSFRSSFIPTVLRVCQSSSSPFLDLNVWTVKNTSKLLLTDFRPLCVGMKGLPGRRGLTMGWTRPNSFKPDLNGSVLKGYIGEDIENYRRWMK